MIVQGHTNPKVILAVPPSGGDGSSAVARIPALWFYPSVKAAQDALPTVRRDRARRGGTVPQRIDNVIYWWGTLRRAPTDLVETIRVCTKG